MSVVWGAYVECVAGWLGALWAADFDCLSVSLLWLWICCC